MRDKEIVGLWESYLEVCETQQLDELSDKTVSNALNARIAATGAAINRENKNRTPQNVRDTVRAADKEVSMRRAVAKRRKRKLGEETDLFDTILEHLVDEGYADTEEAALKIMANMSEEWRQSIVEQDLTARQKYLMKKVGDMNAEKPGSAHTAVPGKQSAGGALDRANRSAMQLRGV
jgi:hypothetical protein